MTPSDQMCEAAAKVADEEAIKRKKQSDSLSDYVDDFERGVMSGAKVAAIAIAAAIRALPRIPEPPLAAIKGTDHE